MEPGRTRLAAAARLLTVTACGGLAAVLTARDVVATSPDAVGCMALLPMLAAFGVTDAEISRWLDRRHVDVLEDPSQPSDVTASWTFVAAVLLTPAAAVALAGGFAVHRHIRTRHYGRSAGPRTFVQLIATVAAVHSASAVIPHGSQLALSSTFGPARILAAAIAFIITAGSVRLALLGNASRRLTVGAGDIRTTTAAASLGALLALAYAVAGPAALAFAAGPAHALHRATQVRGLRIAATTDGRTGLLTPQAWRLHSERRLRRIFDKYRTAGSAALITVDLDHFKQINDTHGHHAGDAVLRGVAAALRQAVRSDDLVGRLGGEEFAVLLTQHGGSPFPAETLEHVAERIRSRDRHADHRGPESSRSRAASRLHSLRRSCSRTRQRRPRPRSPPAGR